MSLVNKIKKQEGWNHDSTRPFTEYTDEFFIGKNVQKI